MKNNGLFSKVLAIAGTALVWYLIPALALIYSGIFITDYAFRFQYLVPWAPLPLELVGGALLFWAARRAQIQLRLIGWGLGIAVFVQVVENLVSLVYIVQMLVTGLSGLPPLPWMFILARPIIYWLALVAIGIGGALLLRALFKAPALSS
jgi:hypothetical protein